MSNDSSFAHPLYLYIDCSAIQLRSLEDAIAAEVNRLDVMLTPDRAFSMCRNGLLVLLVDGFDELLGGVGYTDALQVLRGVLRKLGQSGTMLISARSAYLANQYRDNLEASGDLSTVVSHQLLNLEPWSLSEVEGLFKNNPNWLPFRSAIGNEELALLRLPFFARVFDAWVLTHSDVRHGDIRLVQMMLDAYLDREMKKLHAGTFTDVTQDQLSELLHECCSEMFVAGSTDLDQEQFLLCASVALGCDLVAQRTRQDENLANRISGLCGISVDREGGGSADKRFSFDHRIYYESLLIDVIGERYLSSQPAEGSGAFDREVLSASVLGEVVHKWPQKVSGVVGQVGARCRLGTTLSRNIGALYSLMVRERQHLGIIRKLQGIEFADLDLNGVAIDSLDLVDSNIHVLTIDPETSGSLNVIGGRIGTLVLTGGADAHRRGLFSANIRGRCQVEQVHVEAELSGARRRIFELLDQYGWTCSPEMAEAVQENGTSEFEVFVEELLDKLIVRQERVFSIEESSRIPGDGAPYGTFEPMNPKWARLVQVLLDASLAEKKRMNASGPARSRVTLRVPAARIAERDSVDPAISAFWATVRHR